MNVVGLLLSYPEQPQRYRTINVHWSWGCPEAQPQLLDHHTGLHWSDSWPTWTSLLFIISYHVYGGLGGRPRKIEAEGSRITLVFNKLSSRKCIFYPGWRLSLSDLLGGRGGHCVVSITVLLCMAQGDKLETHWWTHCLSPLHIGPQYFLICAWWLTITNARCIAGENHFWITLQSQHQKCKVPIAYFLVKGPDSRVLSKSPWQFEEISMIGWVCLTFQVWRAVDFFQFKSKFHLSSSPFIFLGTSRRQASNLLVVVVC